MYAGDLLKEAIEGNRDAQYSLACLFYNGEDVGQDVEAAFRWFKMAADQGHADAQCHLGWCYANGTGVAKDEVRAVELYRKAADQGHAGAQSNLRVCRSFEAGEHEKNLAKLRELEREIGAERPLEAGEAGAVVTRVHKKVDRLGIQDVHQREQVAQCLLEAELGRALATALLSDFDAIGQGLRNIITTKDAELQALRDSIAQQKYMHGRGVAKDEGHAVELSRKAADQGHAGAQDRLGVCYTNGRGVGKDEVHAGYRKAAELGPKESEAKLCKLSPEGTGSERDRMEGAQISELEPKPNQNLEQSTKSNPTLKESNPKPGDPNQPDPKPDAKADPKLSRGSLPSMDAEPIAVSDEEVQPVGNPQVSSGAWLDELKLMFERTGGLQSVPIMPNKKSRDLLQRLLSDKMRLSEAEQRMKGSPAASAYFTEMHRLMGNLFTGAQAIGSGNVQSAERIFVTTVSILAQNSVSWLPFVGALAAGAMKAGIQALEERDMRNAAEKVCRVAPAGLAHRVTHSAALGLALGREGVVQVLWNGGGVSNQSIALMVRQRWAVLMGLSESQAKLRGLVEDDLARILESILAERVTGVQGDTDGVEVCRRLIEVALEAGGVKAQGSGAPAAYPAVSAVGIGKVPVAPPGVPADVAGQAGAVATGGDSLSPLDVKSLQDEIKELKRTQLYQLEKQRRLEKEVTRLRRAAPSAGVGGRSDGSTMQLLQEDDTQTSRGFSRRVADHGQQLEVHQAAIVAIQAELGAKGQKIVLVGGRVAAPRWFHPEQTV